MELIIGTQCIQNVCLSMTKDAFHILLFTFSDGNANKFCDVYCAEYSLSHNRSSTQWIEDRIL